MVVSNAAKSSSNAFVHTDVCVRSGAVEMIVGARASTQSGQ
jgi:hypothetical protein